MGGRTRSRRRPGRAADGTVRDRVFTGFVGLSIGAICVLVLYAVCRGDISSAGGHSPFGARSHEGEIRADADGLEVSGGPSEPIAASDASGGPRIIGGLAAEGNCEALHGNAKFIFCRGFRDAAFVALFGVNAFYRLANSTGRIMSGPFLGDDMAFRNSTYEDDRNTAPDYIGNYFSLRTYLTTYENLCVLSSGVRPEVVCPDPSTVADVCIGPYCVGNANGVAMTETGEQLEAGDDLADTISRNPVLANATCLVVKGYQKGVQDPLLKESTYADMYGWHGTDYMEPSWWIYELFQPSELMVATARAFRESTGIESVPYYAVRVRSEHIIRDVCAGVCLCTHRSVVQGALRRALRLFTETAAPIYVATDARAQGFHLAREDIEPEREHINELLGHARTRLYVNDEDTRTEVLVDVINLVHAAQCVSFGSGGVMSAVNYLRARDGKKPCEIFYRLISPREGFCTAPASRGIQAR